MKRVTLFLRISKPMGQEKSPKVPVCHLFLCVSFIACLLVCVPRCVWTLCVVQAASMRIEAAHRPPTLKPPTDKFKYSLQTPIPIDWPVCIYCCNLYIYSQFECNTHSQSIFELSTLHHPPGDKLKTIFPSI